MTNVYIVVTAVLLAVGLVIVAIVKYRNRRSSSNNLFFNPQDFNIETPMQITAVNDYKYTA